MNDPPDKKDTKDAKPENELSKEQQAPSESESLDLTLRGSESKANPGPAPSPTLTEYNPDEARERVRGYIAYSLIGILAAVLLMSFVGLMLNRFSMADLKELMTIVFGPLIALVAAATGFLLRRQEVAEHGTLRQTERGHCIFASGVDAIGAKVLLL